MKTASSILLSAAFIIFIGFFCQSLMANTLTDSPVKNAATLLDHPNDANTNSVTSDNSDGPGKKKAKKKKARRKCVYCPSMRTFEKGQWEANFNAGLVPTYLMDNATMIVPPLSVGAEYRISEKFSLGANLSHSTSESQPKLVGDGINATWTNAHFMVGLRPGIHITRVENWDFYGGFSIGLNYSSVSGKASSESFDLEKMEGHLGIEQHKLSPSFFGFTGVRYVVSPKWTVNSEIGFGISIFSIGANYLLN